MADKRYRGNHVDATSLSGVATASITLTGRGLWTIQASLISAAGLRLYYRITNAAGLSTATTLANADGYLGDGGAVTLAIPPGATEYCNVFLTTSAGVSANGGASDYIYKSIEV